MQRDTAVPKLLVVKAIDIDAGGYISGGQKLYQMQATPPAGTNAFPQPRATAPRHELACPASNGHRRTCIKASRLAVLQRSRMVHLGCTARRSLVPSKCLPNI
jgi:hypothetical protein